MKKNNKLTKVETEELVKLLKKVRLPAPYSVFVALCKSVPVIAVDIALMKDKNNIFLTYRSDKFYKGWHVPGSILTYQEKPIQALYRMAKKELGLEPKDLLGVKFQTYFAYKDVRESGISLFFTASSKVKPKDGKYFPLNNPPKDFLKVQNQEINYLKKLL